MRNADQDDLDAEFPLGDDSLESASEVTCPYCWQKVEITLDPAGGSSQEYEEDCEVCCGPWHVHVTYSASGAADVTIDAAE